MEIEYQYSREDFIQFNKSYCAYSFKKRLPLIIVLTLIIPAFSYNGKSFDINQYILIAGITLLALVGIAYFIPLSIALATTNKALKADDTAFEKKKLTITDEGVYVQSESTSYTRLWASMIAIGSINNFIFIRLADKRVLIYPDRFFKSDAEKINFLGLIRNRIMPGEGFFKTRVNIPNQKPNYWILLLCLIPIAGLIAGVTFVILGLSKYKDKRFLAAAVIGLACAVSVILIMTKTDVFGFQSQQVKFSQNQINAVMGAVEFYKLKNGTYPDSLGQLTKNSSVWIWDPLRPGGKVTKTDEYNYQKVGNHYYLFSSGIDGIPGNADDIYPEVAKSDSSKFGLIHK